MAMRKIFRFNKEVYGNKCNLLPKALAFLRSVPFFCVVEDQRGPKIDVRIEVSVKFLKKILKKCDSQKIELDKLHAKISELEQEKACLESNLSCYLDISSVDDFVKIKNELQASKINEQKLELRIKDAEASAERSIAEFANIQDLIIRHLKFTEPGDRFRTFFNQEIKHILRWPPLQGGAPGLKK